MNIGIIGGADGPTEIFVSQPNPMWINRFGLVILVLILIPNLLYAWKGPKQENRCTDAFLNHLEQFGRYACMLLMVFPLGMDAHALGSVMPLLVLLFGNLALLAAYWVFWGFYFRAQTKARAIVLAVLPTLIFLLCGIIMHHPALVLSAAVFGIAHITVTVRNH